MVFQRIISRFPRRSRISGNMAVTFSDQSLPQIAQKRSLFSGIPENYQGPTRVLHNAMPRLLGNLGMKLGFTQENSLHASLKFANGIHTVGPKEFERDMNNGPVEPEKNSGLFETSNQRVDEMNRQQSPFEPARNTGFFEGSNQRVDEMNRQQSPFEPARNTGFYESLTKKFADMDRTQASNETGVGRPFMRGFAPSESDRNMNFVRGTMRDNENFRSGLEQNADIVHVKIMRNNAFVTVTDSKGNKKIGASAGLLAEMKGGPKVAKYSAEATAEHVGRLAKSMGLKSVVMKVNGFTFFKKKKLAILSFRDGYTNSRSDRNPIVHIEDTTRKPHNGCRRKKQRRV